MECKIDWLTNTTPILTETVVTGSNITAVDTEQEKRNERQMV